MAPPTSWRLLLGREDNQGDSGCGTYGVFFFFLIFLNSVHWLIYVDRLYGQPQPQLFDHCQPLGVWIQMEHFVDHVNP